MKAKVSSSSRRRVSSRTSRRGPCPASTASPCTVDQIGYSMPSRRLRLSTPASTSSSSTVYALNRPHGSYAAGAVVIAAGLYEFMPLKQYCRHRCRVGVCSGFKLGIYCVGSSIGLMLTLVALGVMSVTRMSVIAILVLAQKLLPAKAAIDAPVALAIVGLGILIILAPSSIPGLTPPM